MYPYTSSLILSDIEPDGVCLVASVKGLKLFNLCYPFIAQSASPFCSHCKICFILILLVILQALDDTPRHLDR